MKPRFIAIEGIDGSGKSTQARLLADYLQESGIPVALTREPTDTPTGTIITDVLRGNLQMNPITLAAQFVADRLNHALGSNGILRQIEDGRTVITDRYYFSSYAYQGASIGVERVIRLNAPVAEILRPDLTIYLDVDVDTAMWRIHARNEQVELFEKRDFLERVSKAYRQAIDMLASTEHVEVIDASRPPEAVHAEIVSRVNL